MIGVDSCLCSVPNRGSADFLEPGGIFSAVAERGADLSAGESGADYRCAVDHPGGSGDRVSPRFARLAQPLVQLAASIPATALFPVLLLVLIRLRGGVEIAAMALMLPGTQWYILFNVIAGAMAIPHGFETGSQSLPVQRTGPLATLDSAGNFSLSGDRAGDGVGRSVERQYHRGVFSFPGARGGGAGIGKHHQPGQRQRTF